MSEEVDYEEDMAGGQGGEAEATSSSHRDRRSGGGGGGGRRESNNRASHGGSSKGSSSSAVTKGRGHGSAHMYDEGRYEGRGGIFERIGGSSGSGPIQCEYRYISPF